VSVIPIGVIQLNRAITESYAAARSVSFYQEDLILLLNELRLPGDALIVFASALLVYELIPPIYRLLTNKL
jgi:nitric oxide reductase subunit B